MFRRRLLAKPPDPTLDENLIKAHMRARADEYMATVYATTLVVAIATVVAGIAVGLLFVLSGDVLIGLVIGILLPILGPVGTFFVLQSTPGRGRRSAGARSTGRSVRR